MKKILIYGDSNVWGDNFITGMRIPDDKQWPNILQAKLRNKYKILQEGLPGRLAGNEELIKTYKNGKDSFPSTFRTNAPVDIIIIALGTNDLQLKYSKNAKEISDYLFWYRKVVEEQFNDEDDKIKYFINKQMPKFVYILPPCFDYKIGAKNIFDEGSEEERKNITKIFSEKYKNEYLTLDELPLAEDGIHLNYEGHKIMAEKVEEFILENE